MSFLRKTYIIGSFVLFAGILWGTLFLRTLHKEKIVLKNLESIPIEDRYSLEAFFHLLLFKEGGAYVLIGDKPAAVTVFYSPDAKEIASPFARKYHRETRILRKGWQTWEKYQCLFPSERFVLLAKLKKDSDPQRFEVVLLNKKSTETMMRKHRADFHQILGSTGSFDQFLSKYRDEDRLMTEQLNEHHGLLGILLGFGRENAFLFQKYARTWDSPYEERPFCQTELDSAFYEPVRCCCKWIYLPAFKVDPSSEETKMLREKYIMQRQRIYARYRGKNVLEETLKQFCS
jgi:hypothetical protein